LNTNNTEELTKLRAKVLDLEKMASLGLLNAGIMHEIQNPMNFIINFSKMSVELLEELKDLKADLIEKISTDQAEDLEDISGLLSQNIEKIKEHGERVDTIAKSILGFSRKQGTDKSPLKLNEMISLYIGFAYHAMRVKAKGFNVTIEERLDPSIKEIKAFSGDLSRAFLNLANNAFFATWEKSKETNKEYIPKLIVSTTQEGEEVWISVEDNGSGISSEQIEKVYEPFFTTKKDEQGTGLGLYITKQIIEEQHQGKLEVVSEEGGFTRFTIKIPSK
jgi:signal transduction histidine kinase